MSVGSLIARLIEAGTPADLVADVAMELARASAAQEIIETRRAKDRERKRDSAPRNSAESEESAEIQTGPLPLDKSPQTPKINPHPAPTGYDIAPTRKADPWKAIPEGVSQQAWTGLLANRRAKKSANSPHAYSLICGKLKELAEAGYPPGEMVDLAVERGWTTVFEPKEHRNGNRPQTSNDPTYIRDPVLRDLASRGSYPGVG